MRRPRHRPRNNSNRRVCRFDLRCNCSRDRSPSCPLVTSTSHILYNHRRYTHARYNCSKDNHAQYNRSKDNHVQYNCSKDNHVQYHNSNSNSNNRDRPRRYFELCHTDPTAACPRPVGLPANRL